MSASIELVEMRCYVEHNVEGRKVLNNTTLI